MMFGDENLLQKTGHYLRRLYRTPKYSLQNALQKKDENSCLALGGVRVCVCVSIFNNDSQNT